MSLSYNDIEFNIYQMDSLYDANFGEWIRNESNSAIIGFHLKKYIKNYKISENIIVLKWIVKNWTLRSILNLLKKLILENYRPKKKEEDWKIKIIQGLCYTWNSLFISDFLLYVLNEYTLSEKIYICTILFSHFPESKRKQIVVHLGNDIEPEIKNIILKPHLYSIANKLSDSLVDVFTVF